MPLISVNATPTGLMCHAAKQNFETALAYGLKGNGPVIIMIHGFKFSPGHRDACPHSHILSLTPNHRCWKATSWPRGLGISDIEGEVTGIGFGWNARGSLWDAYNAALHAGKMLAHLIERIGKIAPHRPIHALSHSLGARVLLTAIANVHSNSLKRAVLLNPAEYKSVAQAALHSPAGREVELIAVTSRENDIFDFIMERLIRSNIGRDRTLNAGLPDQSNTLSIQIDCAKTLLNLKNLGIEIEPTDAVMCHWSTYLRPGVFSLYQALFGVSASVDLGVLKQVLPKQMEPRWSRIRQKLRDSQTPLRLINPDQTGSPLSGGRIIKTIAQ